MTDAHARFSALLPAYIAEVLSDDDRAWVEQHMAECEECSTLHTRLLTRLPQLRDPEGHAPVSVLEDLAQPDSPLTALERQLVLQHLNTCAACTAEAQAIGYRVKSQRPHPTVWLWRTGFAAAAVLVLFLAVRREGPASLPVPSPIKDRAAAPTRPSTTSRLVLTEPTRGTRGPIDVALVDSSTQTLSIELPPIFLSDSSVVTIRVLDTAGIELARRSFPASEAMQPIAIDAPAPPWRPGRYGIELTQESHGDPLSARRFAIELRRR